MNVKKVSLVRRFSSVMFVLKKKKKTTTAKKKKINMKLIYFYVKDVPAYALFAKQEDVANV